MENTNDDDLKEKAIKLYTATPDGDLYYSLEEVYAMEDERDQIEALCDIMDSLWERKKKARLTPGQQKLAREAFQGIVALHVSSIDDYLWESDNPTRYAFFFAPGEFDLADSWRNG